MTIESSRLVAAGTASRLRRARVRGVVDGVLVALVFGFIAAVVFGLGAHHSGPPLVAAIEEPVQ